jgi:hypothetical protein
VEPEGELSPENKHAAGTHGTALVLALRPGADHPSALTLRFAGRRQGGRETTSEGPVGLDQFQDLLDRAASESGELAHDLPDGSRIELASGGGVP